MILVDSHCHIAEFEDLSTIIDEAVSNGVKLIIGVGEDPVSNIKTINISERYPDIVKPCIGFHPWEAAEADDKTISEFERQVRKYVDLICGIGEVGLDRRFIRGTERLKRQRLVFEKAVELAREYDLPLNIHSVMAEKEVFELLVKNDIDRALFHWYTGSYEVLEQLLSMGYRISVNLALKYSRRARGVAERAPLMLTLLESDSPYEFRGERASPASVVKVAKLLAEIKGVSLEEVAQITTQNARIFFSL